MGRDGVSVTVDPELGGRWTSLLSATGREWLWSRHEPRRTTVVPGSPFADAGGLEECLPTIGGLPDHGDAWSRPWRPDGDGLLVEGAAGGDAYRLRRRISTAGDSVTAAYRLEGRTGWRFIWAAHALLDLSPGARLELPHGAAATVGTEAGLRSFRWPYLDDTDVSALGPADGTALMVVVPDLASATVVDGGDRLTMSVTAPGQPTGVALWRNLGGWPEGAPYRSIGVEPLLGRTGDLDACGPDDAVTVPASGVVEWTLTIVADRVDRPRAASQ